MKKNTLLSILGTLLLLSIAFLGNWQITAKVTDEEPLAKNNCLTSATKEAIYLIGLTGGMIKQQPPYLDFGQKNVSIIKKSPAKTVVSEEIKNYVKKLCQINDLEINILDETIQINTADQNFEIASDLGKILELTKHIIKFQKEHERTYDSTIIETYNLNLTIFPSNPHLIHIIESNKEEYEFWFATS